METEPQRQRCRFQFRLRTLLIMVALLSVYCGPFAWLLQDRQRLIRELDESRVAERRTSGQLERAILVVEQQQRKLLSAIREIVVSNTTLEHYQLGGGDTWSWVSPKSGVFRELTAAALESSRLIESAR